MDKQSVLAFVLIGIVFMVWMYFNTPQESQKSHTKKPTAADTITKAQQKPSVAQAKADRQEEAEDSSGSYKLFRPMRSPETIITIDNEIARYELTNKGGKIKKVFLKHFNNWYIPTNSTKNDSIYQWIQLLNVDKGSSIDLEFISSDGKKISTSNLEFSSSLTDYRYSVKSNDSISIAYTYAAADGKTIKKSFTFFGNKYDSRLDLDLIGFKEIVSGNTLDIVWDAGLRFVEANSADEANSANASVYHGGEQVKIDAPHSSEKITQDFNGTVEWASARNKYFTVILAPNTPSQYEGAFIKGYTQLFNDGGVKEFYSLRYKLPVKNDLVRTSMLVYVGPVAYDVLHAYNRHFNDIVDFGSFFGLRMVVRPIAEYLFLPLFNFLHTFIPNYGIVILIFSLIIKILLHPLTRQSLKSMQKMQLLQPKIAELKEKLKDDQQKLSSETMKLYSTYGINPMGGCLPMVLQMPIFIALWGLFQSAVELRQQPFIWWITDLSRPDTVLHLGFRIPIFGIDQISALATLMGITMFIQQKMTVKDPQQQSLVYVMPIMFTFIFMSFPAGLNLYYFVFNILSIAQQYYTSHHMKGVTLEPVKNAGKQGFMQRMMAAAEAKAKEQQQTKRKK